MLRILTLTAIAAAIGWAAEPSPGTLTAPAITQVETLHTQAPDAAAALTRTTQWWHDYWNRSWLFTHGDGEPDPTPMGRNSQPFRLGADSTGANLFSGAMARASFYDRVLTPAEITALATGTPNSLFAE